VSASSGMVAANGNRLAVVTRGGGGALLRAVAWIWCCPRRGGDQREAAALEGDGQKGAATPRVSGSEKKKKKLRL
jgi:hypothetical protein